MSSSDAISRALFEQHARFACSPAKQRADALIQELSTRKTSLLLSRERAALEGAAEAILKREKQEHTRRERITRDQERKRKQWVDEEKNAEEIHEAEELQSIREDEAELVQAQDAVASTHHRTEGRLKKLSEELEHEIKHKTELCEDAEAEAKIEAAKYEKGVMEELRAFKDDRRLIYDKELENLDTSIVSAEKDLEIKMGAGSEKVQRARAAVHGADAKIAEEKETVKKTRKMVEDQIAATAAAQLVLDQSESSLRKEIHKVDEEKNLLKRSAEGADNKVLAQIEKLEADLQSKGGIAQEPLVPRAALRAWRPGMKDMVTKYKGVTLEQIKQERMLLANQIERLRAATSSATAKRQKQLQATAEKVLESKKMSVTANMAFENAQQEHERAIMDKKVAVRKMKEQLEAQEAQDASSVEALMRAHEAKVAGAEEALNQEKDMQDAMLARKKDSFGVQASEQEQVLARSQERVVKLAAALQKLQEESAALLQDGDKSVLDAQTTTPVIARGETPLVIAFVPMPVKRRVGDDAVWTDGAVVVTMLARTKRQTARLHKLQQAWDAEQYRNVGAEREREERLETKEASKNQAIAAVTAEKKAAEELLPLEQAKIKDTTAKGETMKKAHAQAVAKSEAQEAAEIQAMRMLFTQDAKQQQQSLDSRRANLEENELRLAKRDAAMEVACKAVDTASVSCWADFTKARHCPVEAELKKELAVSEKRSAEARERHASEEKAAIEKCAAKLATAQTALRIQREKLDFERKEEEGKLQTLRVDANTVITRNQSRLSQLRQNLNAAARDRNKENEGLHATNIRLGELKAREHKHAKERGKMADDTGDAYDTGDWSSVEQVEEGGDLADVAKLHVLEAQLYRMGVECLQMPGSGGGGTRNSVLTEKHLEREERRMERQMRVTQTQLQLEDDRIKVLFDSKMQAHAASEKAAMHTLELEKEEVTHAFKDELEALDQQHKENLEQIEEHLKAVAAQRKELEFKIDQECQAIGQTDRWRRELDLQREQRRAESTSLVAAMGNDARTEEGKKLEAEIQRMIMQSHVQFEWFKKEAAKKVENLRQEESQAIAEVEATRKEVEAERKEWSEMTKAAMAEIESARKQEVQAAKAVQDRTAQMGEKTRVAKMDLEGAERQVEADRRRVQAEASTRATQLQAEEKQFSAAVEKKLRAHEAFVDASLQEVYAEERSRKLAVSKQQNVVAEMERRYDNEALQGMTTLQHKMVAKEKAHQIHQSHDRIQEEEKNKLDMEAMAFSKMITEQEDKAQRDVEERIKQHQDKQEQVERNMTGEADKLTERIAMLKAEVGKPAQEAAAKLKNLGTKVPQLQKAAEQAKEMHKASDARIFVLKQQLLDAEQRLSQADSLKRRSATEMDRILAMENKDKQHVIDEKEALQEAIQLERDGLRKQFEEAVTKKEEAQMALIKKRKETEAEDNLARRRRLQKWMTERRKQVADDTKELQASVPQAAELAKQVEEDLKAAARDRSEVRMKAAQLRKRQREDREQQMLDQEDTEKDRYEREMSDLLLHMEQCKAELLSREAKEDKIRNDARTLQQEAEAHERRMWEQQQALQAAQARLATEEKQAVNARAQRKNVGGI
eukprot:gene632-1065_t